MKRWTKRLVGQWANQRACISAKLVAPGTSRISSRLAPQNHPTQPTSNDHRLADRNEAPLPLHETYNLTKDIQDGMLVSQWKPFPSPQLANRSLFAPPQAPTRPFYKQVLTPSTSPSTCIAERPEFRGFEVLSD
ncbi:uncharacterized protein LY79DRAFT_8318 [Colletotrichum navitas]|uniref:Uncharacterized protein n=1 Tax=Colletotrichum navitas TaxID=681940 RepID=A0AAD8QDA7_9PEZI|nr:uncharacterized protein LY79DRAFT_8318 [Colletotrichum navitas]KAK1600129.1 hypothetical protein LY79DRAFT_8318 [Colletotrichum navitas]